jgi:hypothetical protein
MNAKVSSKRTERKSLFQRGPQSITGDKDPNFVYRFVNDTGSRVSNFQQAGYEVVQDTELLVGDSRVFDPSDIGSGKKVTSNDGTVSYLMRIKKEWFDEDQAKKDAYTKETEATMKKEASQGMYGSIKTS